ncbi:MAG: arginine N-succinyltransferase [Alphaproteobacteria bacterium]
MIVVRPVTTQNHAEILALAKEAGIGFTSLPADAGVLEAKIAHSVASFSGSAEEGRKESFLFVLEDTESGELVGTTGIAAHVGMRQPFYSYKLSTIVQASKIVGVYSQQKVLHMVNDYTGATEIGSLFLMPAYRRDGNGKFLSRARYLMLAEFPDMFSDVVIAEIRGMQDEQGHSPFYRNLAQHFFQMDFKHADFTNATKGGQFISDLMPKYPIYVNLLAEEAQAAIAQPFAASKPAMELLKKEGFRNQGYVDVFDAGPTMQAERSLIKSVRESRRRKVVAIGKPEGDKKYIISNTSLSNFRVVRDIMSVGEDGVTITEQTAANLMVEKGDAVRYVAA